MAQQMPDRLYVTYDEEADMYCTEPETTVEGLMDGEETAVAVYEFKHIAKLRKTIVLERV